MATTCGVDNSITFGSDPNNSTTINAVPGYGAIQVSWNYPTINAHAVAHVILRRGTSSAGTGSELAIVKGSVYRDPMGQAQSGTTYYYWIQLVSVNGTVLATVGPASATASSLANDTLGLISGQIYASDLAAALRSEIEEIPSLRSDLIDETTGRLNSLITLESDLANLGLDVTTAFAEIITDRQTMLDGDNALASQITALAVSNGTNLAAIIEEQSVRLAADSAEATSRLAMGVQIRDDISAAYTKTVDLEATNLGSRVSTLEQLESQTLNAFYQDDPPTVEDGRRVGTIWYETDNDNKPLVWQGADGWVSLRDGTILDSFAVNSLINTAVTGADFASASSQQNLEASLYVVRNGSGTITGTGLDDLSDTLNNYQNTGAPQLVDAKLQDFQVAQVGYCKINGNTDPTIATPTECSNQGGQWIAAAPLAQAVKNIEINDGGSGLKLEESMALYKDEIGNLKGEYTVKFQGSGSNAVIGGFGLAVDGPDEAPTVSAHFDVDLFSVGKLNGAELVPFVVKSGTVYIKDAVIETASIDTLKLANGSVTKPEIIVSTATKFYYTSSNTWSNSPTFTYEMPRDAGNLFFAIPLKIELSFAYTIDTNAGGPTISENVIFALEYRSRDLQYPKEVLSVPDNQYQNWTAWKTGDNNIVLAFLPLPAVSVNGHFSGFTQILAQSQRQYEFRLAPLDLSSTYWLQAKLFRLHAQFTAMLR